MLDFGTAGVDRFVTLGSPHAPPPAGTEGVVDQTRGILNFCQDACPGAFHDEVGGGGAEEGRAGKQGPLGGGGEEVDGNMNRIGLGRRVRMPFQGPFMMRRGGWQRKGGRKGRKGGGGRRASLGRSGRRRKEELDGRDWHGQKERDGRDGGAAGSKA